LQEILKIKTNLINAIEPSNKNHKKWIFNELEKIIKFKKIKKVGIWGLTYTNNTDTLRRSFAIEIAKWLKEKKIITFAYDTKVKLFSKEIKKILKKNNSLFSNLKSIDVLIINNKSKEFLKVSEKVLKKINKKLIIIDPNYFCRQFKKSFGQNYIYVGKAINKDKIKTKEKKFKFNFKNKVVLITGASKGLGFSVSKAFLNSGANLVICSRNYKEIKKTFLKLNKFKKKNQKIIYSATDISAFSDVKILIKKTLKIFKKIDILVNNAGVYGPKGEIENINWEEFVKTININLLGSNIFMQKKSFHI
jgi:Dehydrogenases with different specificities (related to short-chain alcohol dehydrogenases)